MFELGKTSGYSFAYFTKEKLFTKSHLIQELSQFEEAKKFIPDDINPHKEIYNYENITTINFTQCEKKLRKHYDINENETLIIFKVDNYENNFLIPIVQYEVYHMKKYCKKIRFINM